MMQPERTKSRKQMKARNGGLALTGNTVAFGEFGMKSTELGRISARQIEAGRRVITRYVARGGRQGIRTFPDTPVTKKPLEVRMGSGKGNVEYWAAKVQPGKMLYELEGVPETLAREAFRLAGDKLPVKSIFVRRTLM